MIRNLVLAAAMVLSLGVVGSLVRPSVAEAVPPPLAANCLDPQKANSVSIWSWTASNSSSGRFTMIQSNVADNSTPQGDVLSKTTDALAISGLLNKDFAGQSTLLGTTILIILNAAPASTTFALSIVSNTGPAAFDGWALGDVGFVLFHAELLACYDNVVKNSSVEIDASNNVLHNWATNDSSRGKWLKNSPATPTADRHTGNNSLESKIDYSSSNCGVNGEGFWESDFISVTGGDYVVGAYERSVGSSIGRLEVTGYTFLNIPIFTQTMASRANANWGLMKAPLNISGIVTQVKLRLHADIACTNGTAISGTSHWDDMFLIKIPSGGITP